MKRTQEMLTFKNLSLSLFNVTCEAIFCNLAILGYLFMVLSQIYNAGLVSIFFPLAVFGYALMEECRPGKRFWNIMLKYALFILFLKFTIQLEWWLNAGGLVAFYDVYAKWVLLGLWRVEGVAGLYEFIKPEMIVVFSILGNQYYENIIGLYDKKETEVETIH